MTATDPRAALHALAAIERGSAGPGEERAAELIAGLLGEHGLEAWLEREPAVGGFWQSTGLAAAAGALAGAIGLRGGSRRRSRCRRRRRARWPTTSTGDGTTCAGCCASGAPPTCSPGRGTPPLA